MILTFSPVGQQAYERVIMQRFSAPWALYCRTSNRYFTGTTNNSALGSAALIGGSGPALLPVRSRKGGRLVPIGGNAVLVTGSGGTGYVTGDFVTFSPVNKGRSIVVKVTASAGAIASVFLIDPGSGLLGGDTGVNSTAVQTASLTQLSTTGVGTGATWTATIGINWGGPSGPNPAA